MNEDVERTANHEQENIKEENQQPLEQQSKGNSKKDQEIRTLKEILLQRNETIKKLLPAVRKFQEFKEKIENYNELVYENEDLKNKVNELQKKEKQSKAASRSIHQEDDDNDVQQLKKTIAKLKEENRKLKEKSNLQDADDGTDISDAEVSKAANQILQNQLEEQEMQEQSLEDAKNEAISQQAKRIKQLEEELRNRDKIIKDLRAKIVNYDALDTDLQSVKDEVIEVRKKIKDITNGNARNILANKK